MATAYYTVLERDENDGLFYDVFGSYDKQEARDEMEYLKGDGKKCRLIKTGGTAQQLIDAIAKANGKG